MSEYIEFVVRVPKDEADFFIARFGRKNVKMFGYQLVDEIVRCRDCKHYYKAENYHPNGNYVMRCCKYFNVYNDEVEPDGFCAWGERRTDDNQ